MNINAKGILAHKFHGNYWCVIALQFDSEENARDGMLVLNKSLLNAACARQYAIGKHPEVLVWQGNSEELSICKVVLGSFGADVNKIDSIAKSIDHGEWFAVSIPMEMNNPNQLSLLE